MKNKFRTLLVMSSLLLALSVISINIAGANEKSTTLTLEKAIYVGLENSPNIQQSEISLEKAENALTDIVQTVTDLEEYRKFREDFANVDYYYLDYSQELTTATAIAKAELGVNLAKSGVEASKRLSKLNIEKSYYEVVKAEQGISNAQNALNRVKKLNEQIKAKYKTGMASENEVILSEIDLTKAENAVKIAEYSLQSSLIELSNTIGANVEEGYEFDVDTSCKFFDKSKVDTLIDYAIKNDSELYKATQERIVAEGTLKVSKSSPNATQENKRDAALDLKIKKLNETTTKDKVMKTVRQALLSVYMAETAYSTAENEMKTYDKNYEITYKLYETGSKTYIDVQAAEIALTQADTSLNKALFDYKLSLSNLNLATSGGIDILN